MNEETTTVETPEVSDLSTPEQLDAEYEKMREAFAVKPPMDNDSFEDELPEDNGETEQIPDEAPTDTTEAAPEELPESYKAELAKRDSMFTNLRALHDKQIAELGELRKKGEVYEKFSQMLEQNPALAQNLFAMQNGQQPVQPTEQEAFDPYDPASLDRAVERKLAEKMRLATQQAQAMNQKQFVQNWQNAYQGSMTNLKVQGVDETALSGAIAEVNQMINQGKVPELAWKLKNFDSEIQAAEKRGADKALQSLKKAQNEPKRTVGLTSKSNVPQNNQFKDMNTSQILAQIQKLPVGSPEWNALEAHLRKFR